MADKVLVTGAAGWLGKRLVDRLIKSKYKVRALDIEKADFSFLNKLGAEIVKGDITNPENIKGICKGIHTVIHCVGVIHAKKVKQFYTVNTRGTQNILSEAINSKVKKFIHISSNSVAGTTGDIQALMTEETELKPYLHYGKSKLLGEKLVIQAHKKHNLNVTILRPCWYYGPGQPGRILEFMNMIKSGKPPLFANGKPWRSMTHIDNLIDVIHLVMKNNKSKGQTYWISDERQYSLREIYKTHADLLGAEFNPRNIPKIVSKGFELLDKALQLLGMYNSKIHVAGEMRHNIACSIQKAKDELGYSPRYDLRKGMKEIISDLKKQGKI